MKYILFNTMFILNFVQLLGQTEMYKINKQKDVYIVTNPNQNYKRKLHLQEQVDFNNDGKIDLILKDLSAVGTSTEDYISFFLNKGNNNYIETLSEYMHSYSLSNFLAKKSMTIISCHHNKNIETLTSTKSYKCYSYDSKIGKHIIQNNEHILAYNNNIVVTKNNGTRKKAYQEKPNLPSHKIFNATNNQITIKCKHDKTYTQKALTSEKGEVKEQIGRLTNQFYYPKFKTIIYTIEHWENIGIYTLNTNTCKRTAIDGYYYKVSRNNKIILASKGNINRSDINPSITMYRTHKNKMITKSSSINLTDFSSPLFMLSEYTWINNHELTGKIKYYENEETIDIIIHIL